MKDLFLIVLPTAVSPVLADDNDILFENGDFVTVEGHDRKRQDVLKILETAIGSNPVFPTYGSALPTIAGTVDVSVNEKISESIKEAMAFLVEVESSPRRDERIAGIRSLQVQTDPGDPATKIAKLAVTLQDGQDIEITRSV